MTRSDWAVLAAAVVTAAITARLGWWQLDRAAQKEALAAAIEAQRAKPALRADELPTDPTAVQGVLHRAAVVAGRWLPEATVLLDNRPLEGRVGFVVVTPLVLADGRVLVVQRGWLPRQPGDRTHVPPFATPEAAVTVQGRMTAGLTRLLDLGPDAAGPIRQNLDLDAYGREFRLRLLPFALVQEDAAGAAEDGLTRRWPAPTVGVHKHYGYAFQWFALSALVVSLYVWFRIVRPRRRDA